MSPSPNIAPSIHDLEPIESGGEVGRRGFTFQDYIAVHFLLKMLQEDDILEVWCETQDDITLISSPSQRNDGCEVEFIQVKSNDLAHSWSVAELCKPDSSAKNKHGTSILEKSLAYDRCKEKCRFRIVTSKDVNHELKVLCLPHDSPMRAGTNNHSFMGLCAAIKSRPVASFISPNNNDYKFWAQRTIWHIVGRQEAVIDANLVDLLRVVDAQGYAVSSDQLEEIHRSLVQMAKDAAEYNWAKEPSKKKVTKFHLQQWLLEKIRKTLSGSSGVGVNNLSRKMTDAGLSDSIESAANSRRDYLAEYRTPRYLQLGQRDKVVGEITASLNQLKAEFDADDEEKSGVKFHALCLKEMRRIQEKYSSENDVPLQFFQGCMYDIVNRCVHRFTRPKV